AEVRRTALWAVPVISGDPGCTTLSRADGRSVPTPTLPSTVRVPARPTMPAAVVRSVGASAAGPGRRSPVYGRAVASTVTRPEASSASRARSTGGVVPVYALPGATASNR